MIDEGAAFRTKDEPAESAMDVVNEAGAPMAGGSEDDFEIARIEGVPFADLVDVAKAPAPDQAAQAVWDDDRLALADRFERRHVEVIVMGVGDENEVDRREFVQRETGPARALDHTQPHCPVGIDQDVAPGHLDEKRGMPDPENPRASGGHLGGFESLLTSAAAPERMRDEDLVQELKVRRPHPLLGVSPI